VRLPIRINKRAKLKNQMESYHLDRSHVAAHLYKASRRLSICRTTSPFHSVRPNQPMSKWQIPFGCRSMAVFVMNRS
jgi:hypothetical protein